MENSSLHTAPEKRNILRYLGPVILALTLVAGILIGRFLYSGTSSGSAPLYAHPGKIDLILDIIKRDYVDTVDTQGVVDRAIPDILRQLDPHSVYIPAADLERHSEPLDGNFEGIGVSFNVQNDTVLIITVLSGGPSAKAGLMPGDRIVTVNDTAFAGTGISSDDVIKKLKGPKGSPVKIGIARRGVNGLLDYEIIRDEIPLYSVDVAYMINSETGFIKIARFARTTYDEFTESVQKLKDKGMSKLIVDLRGNGGGYLDAATKIADEFLDEGKLIVYTQGRARSRVNYYAEKGGLCTELEVVVLVDSWSASASEILSGALQDNDIGHIVGQRTFGKGLVQEPTFFRDGSSMRLTIARYYTPTGRCIQKPYDHGLTEYEHEIALRFDHGEMMTEDSIYFSDDDKYTTPGGRIVYGGGGIMPDLFVATDTSYYSDFFHKISAKGLIYEFALQYADQNRSELNKYTTAEEMGRYFERSTLVSDFMAYLAKKEITVSQADLKKSGEVLTIYLQAYTARNVLDNDGFYPIYGRADNTLQKAIEFLYDEE